MENVWFVEHSRPHPPTPPTHQPPTHAHAHTTHTCTHMHTPGLQAGGRPPQKPRQGVVVACLGGGKKKIDEGNQPPGVDKGGGVSAGGGDGVTGCWAPATNHAQRLTLSRPKKMGGGMAQGSAAGPPPTGVCRTADACRGRGKPGEEWQEKRRRPRTRSPSTAALLGFVGPTPDLFLKPIFVVFHFFCAKLF